MGPRADSDLVGEPRTSMHEAVQTKGAEMSERSSSTMGLAENDTVVAIEIEFECRWDALALSQRLSSFHSFLVQHEAQRWIVHARAPGCRGEGVADALRAIDEWIAERGLEGASCRVGGRPRRLVGWETE
jgi:hypothetical protein